MDEQLYILLHDIVTQLHGIKLELGEIKNNLYVKTVDTVIYDNKTNVNEDLLKEIVYEEVQEEIKPDLNQFAPEDLDDIDRIIWQVEKAIPKVKNNESR